MQIECESIRNGFALWTARWHRHQTRRRSNDQRRNHVRQLPAGTSPPKIRSLPETSRVTAFLISRRRARATAG